MGFTESLPVGAQHCPIKILYLCWRGNFIKHSILVRHKILVSRDSWLRNSYLRLVNCFTMPIVMLSHPEDGKPCGKDSKSSLCFDADLISYNASISACSSDPTHIAAEPENGHES